MIVFEIFLFVLLIFLFFRNCWVFLVRLKILAKYSIDVYYSLPSYEIMFISISNWSKDPKGWVKDI